MLSMTHNGLSTYHSGSVPSAKRAWSINTLGAASLYLFSTFKNMSLIHVGSTLTILALVFLISLGFWTFSSLAFNLH